MSVNTAFRIEVLKNHLLGVKLQKNLTSSGKAYFYTLDHPKLTSSQRDFYEENGYLLVKNLIPYDILDRCRQRFLDIIDGKVKDLGYMFLMKEILHMGSSLTGEHLYHKLQDILHDDVLCEYTEYSELLDYVQCFTGPNIVGAHSMLINKPPGTSIHPPHQDLYYFPFRPTNRIVAVWTAMEKVYKENGCLYVVPGSHKLQLHPHEYPPIKKGKVNKAFHGIQNYDELFPEENIVHLLMEKGDTVFFHPLLVHGSGLNTTKNCRKAISCHYAASDCQYIDVTGTVQENIAKEVEAIAKIRGMNVNFHEFWHVRSKCVRGERISF